MSAYVSLPDYLVLSTRLDQDNAAQCHGFLCGLLCTDAQLSFEAGVIALTETVGGNATEFADDELIQALFNATVQQLNDAEFGFIPLLPDDDEALDLRVENLALWCQGFLSGLGTRAQSLPQNDTLTDEIGEFLSDVDHIAQAGLDATSPGEDDEVAYTEIVEYLRIGVLLVNQEFNWRGDVASESTVLH